MVRGHRWGFHLTFSVDARLSPEARRKSTRRFTPTEAPISSAMSATRQAARNWSGSSGPRLPKGSGGLRSGWSSALASSAPRRGSRPSPPMAPTGGRSDRRRAGGARRDRRAARPAAAGRRPGRRAAPPAWPPTSRPGSACCAGPPRRTTYNVVCELGPADAERTVVLIAHHDAAHSGLVFHPRSPRSPTAWG